MEWLAQRKYTAIQQKCFKESEGWLTITCSAGLHFTYPRDKRHAAQEARALSEAAREVTAGVGLARSSSWSALTSTGDNEESELLSKDKRNRRLL